MSTSSLLHIAVVTETPAIDFNQISRVSAALQKQVSRDLAPIWDIRATVDAFATLEDVPIDYWPIIISDNIPAPGASGIHLDKDGQPFALVQNSPTWTLTASHECLEMLCDPTGNKVRAGPSPDPRQGRVLFLLEVCDPSEASAFAYTVNGVTVSDFYTPNYFDPVVAAGVRYSFTGALRQPRQVLKGGYISWHDPSSDHWFQQTFFGETAEFRDLGVFSQLEGSIRSQIYRQTPEASKFRAHPADAQLSMTAAAAVANVGVASAAKARNLRVQIENLQ